MGFRAIGFRAPGITWIYRVYGVFERIRQGKAHLGPEGSRGTAFKT